MDQVCDFPVHLWAAAAASIDNAFNWKAKIESLKQESEFLKWKSEDVERNVISGRISITQADGWLEPVKSLEKKIKELEDWLKKEGSPNICKSCQLGQEAEKHQKELEDLFVKGDELTSGEGAGEPSQADDSSEGNTIIGIDLGNTFSCVATYRNGNVEIISNERGNHTTPSWVAFTDSGRLVIGEAAMELAAVDPDRTIFNVKRLIGRNFDDEEVQRDMKFDPYKIFNKDGKPYIQVEARERETRDFRPEVIIALVLKKMKKTAEAFLRKTVKDAVVSVPASFNDAQRQVIMGAANIAGLNVARLINEPSAAALAICDLDKNADKKNLLVFDLGGGKLDVSILKLENGAFLVLGSNGATNLGGEDFDQKVMEHYIKLINEKLKKDISKDNRALAKLRRDCECAKRALSSVDQVPVEIDGMDFSEPLTRDLFEELNKDLFSKIMVCVEKALEDAKLKKHEIDEIILVGGSTRIPKVQQLLKDYFGGKEPNKALNPDEAVAYGAAVQGAILRGKVGKETKDVVLSDLAPFSLGIKVADGTVIPVIPRKSALPTKQTKPFFTSHDNQTAVCFEVFEGEAKEAKDCTKLGEFNLTGIPPEPKGARKFDVTFHIDENGILDVRAEDTGTGRAAEIIIVSNKGSLSKEDVARITQEFAVEDKKAKEELEARIQLVTCVYKMKKITKSMDHKRTHKLENVEATLKAALGWLDSNHDAEKDDYDEKRKEVEAVCNPAISAALSRSGDSHQ